MRCCHSYIFKSHLLEKHAEVLPGWNVALDFSEQSSELGQRKFLRWQDDGRVTVETGCMRVGAYDSIFVLDWNFHNKSFILGVYFSSGWVAGSCLHGLLTVGCLEWEQWRFHHDAPATTEILSSGATWLSVVWKCNVLEAQSPVLILLSNLRVLAWNLFQYQSGRTDSTLGDLSRKEFIRGCGTVYRTLGPRHHRPGSTSIPWGCPGGDCSSVLY